jgi:hypothetical protein
MTRADSGLGPTQTRMRSAVAQGRVSPRPAGGRLAQGQLAQGDEVLAAEEFLDRAVDLVADVHLALAQPLEQVIGRDVDQLDFVGPFEDRIGDRLQHRNAGDLRDDVVQ